MSALVDSCPRRISFAQHLIVYFTAVMNILTSIGIVPKKTSPCTLDPRPASPVWTLIMVFETILRSFFLRL